MTLKIINNLSIVENLKLVRFIRAFLLLLLSLPAQAEGWKNDVANEISQRWGQLTADTSATAVSFIGISDNYQLPDCSHAPHMRFNKALQAGRNGIEMYCKQPYWNQHFAIQLHVYRQVVVLTQPLRNKQLINNQQLRLSRQDIGELNKGFFTSTDEILGMEAKRGLPPGTVVSPDMITAPILVKRGTKVVIRVKRPGIQVEMDGFAMGSGQAGEQIRVRNLQSDKIISATVIARGLVQVQ